jgi:hypothetical protein
MTYPYPEILDEKQRANLDDIRNSNPVNYQYVEFDVNDWRNSRKVFTMPANSMFFNSYGRVTSPFTYSEFVNIGLIDDPSAILLGFVATNIGFMELLWSNSVNESREDYRLFIFKESTPIYLSITSSVPIPSSRGSGYLIFEWLSMNRVPGYRRK